MQETKNTSQEAQGVSRETKKKQTISATYTIRAFGENIRKFKELKLIDNKEEQALKELHKKIGENYLRKELGL